MPEVPLPVLRALFVLYNNVWEDGIKKEINFHTFAFTVDVAYNTDEEVVRMTKKKCKIIIGEFEQRILVKALVEFRNQLLGDGRPTEDINDLILKVIDAPIYKWWG